MNDAPELEPPPTVPAGRLPLVLAVCAGCGVPVVEPDPLYRHRGRPLCGGCFLDRVAEER